MRFTEKSIRCLYHYPKLTKGHRENKAVRAYGHMIRTLTPSSGWVQHSTALRVAVLGWFTDLFAALGFAVFGSLAYHRNLDPKTPDRKHTPILFLHGVNHNQSCSVIGRRLLRHYAQRRGQPLGSMYSMNYAGFLLHGRHETIAMYADRVFRKVIQIYKETGQVPTLIGHSMGGLVSTCLAKKLEEAGEAGAYRFEDGESLELSSDERQELRISKIITLGSSFHGSPFADRVVDFLGCLGIEPIAVYKDMMTDARRQERNRPDLLTELRRYAKQASETGKTRYFNVGSSSDQFVTEGYFVTKDPDRQDELHHVGHIGLLLWPPVWGKVHEWLAQE